MGTRPKTQFYSVDSRLWHYFRYKYLFGDTLKSPADLDRRFDAVLSDREAFVYKPGERYAVYSAAADRLAYVQDSGKRISVYRPEKDDIEKLGAPLWLIRTLID